MSTTRKLDDYTVAWICQQALVFNAAVLMLDEVHDLPSTSTPTNLVPYRLGSVSGHNVIVTGLCQTDGEAFVTQMKRTFPGLESGVLISIGSGVPTATDNGMIRLGDVVVSKPTTNHSGTLLYDVEKARIGLLEPLDSGALLMPPEDLLVAAQELAERAARSARDFIGSEMKRIDTSIPDLAKYQHPRPEEDHLQAEPGPVTLGLPVQDELRVVVHRGTIAFGEFPIEDDTIRDRLVNDANILGFGTAAVGAVGDLPCLAIHGVSDYCDSHRTDKWCGYAAAATTAYARQLFAHIPANQYELERYALSTPLFLPTL